MEYGCVGVADSQLEANRLESLSLSVVEVPWEHAVTRLLGELRQEVRQVSLRGKKNTQDEVRNSLQLNLSREEEAEQPASDFHRF